MSDPITAAIVTVGGLMAAKSMSPKMPKQDASAVIDPGTPKPAPDVKEPPQIIKETKTFGGGQQAPVAPQVQDFAVQQSRDRERRRRLKSAQASSTLLTGGQGVTGQANTGIKQLFGE